MISIPEPYSNLDICKEDARYWWSLCPFHDDHRPSMSINKSGDYPGHFRCWSCGAHGSPRRFAQLMGQPQSDYRTRVANVAEDFARRKSEKSKTSHIDFDSLNRQCQQNISDYQIQCLSRQLDVSSESLIRLGIGRDQSCFTFPMLAPDGKIIGIRKRHANGKKTCVCGSSLGLFIPSNLNTSKCVFITESESDLAALLSLGFEGIARPGCCNCFDMVEQWCNRHHIDHAVLVADNDPAGRNGAKQLAEVLVKTVETVCILIPPVKDFRLWTNQGATRNDIITTVRKCPVKKRPAIICQWVPHRKFKGPFKIITTTIGA